MATDKEIQSALKRARKALELRPNMGQRTVETAARLEEGLKCKVREGSWTFDMDLPSEVGGENTAPTPGVYGRSALAGCLAIGIKMQAAEAGVPVDSVEIGLESDCDDRGEFGIDDVPPGFREFRLKIDVNSPAPEDTVRQVIEEALKVSSWLAVFADPQTVKTDLSVNQQAATAAE